MSQSLVAQGPVLPSTLLARLLLLAVIGAAAACSSSDFAGGGSSASPKNATKATKSTDQSHDKDLASADDDDDDNDEDQKNADEDADEDEDSDDGGKKCDDDAIDDGGKVKDGFGGKVYRLAIGTNRLPTDFDSMDPVGQVQAMTLNVPKRDWEDGFPGVPDLIEWFAIVFTGKLTIKDEGAYEFQVISDDGSKVWVDGEQVIDHDGQHSATAKVGATKELKKGRHTIKVEWFQGPRTEIALQLYWRKVGAASFKLVEADDVEHVKDCDLKDLGEFN